MAAGDFFNNMWLMVKSYAFPHTPHLKTVSELQTLVTKIFTYHDVASESHELHHRELCMECQDRLRGYCAIHEEEILEIFPSLEKPLETFKAPNPFEDKFMHVDDMPDEEHSKWVKFLEFRDAQLWTFVRELEAALYFD